MTRRTTVTGETDRNDSPITLCACAFSPARLALYTKMRQGMGQKKRTDVVVGGSGRMCGNALLERCARTVRHSRAPGRCNACAPARARVCKRSGGRSCAVSRSRPPAPARSPSPRTKDSRTPRVHHLLCRSDNTRAHTEYHSKSRCRIHFTTTPD